MDYFICNFPDGSHTVTKCDGNTVIATYTVKNNKCDCIAGSKRGKCKHITFVEKWCPGHYIEQHGVIVNLVPFGILADYAESQ